MTETTSSGFEDVSFLFLMSLESLSYAVADGFGPLPPPACTVFSVIDERPRKESIVRPRMARRGVEFLLATWEDFIIGIGSFLDSGPMGPQSFSQGMCQKANWCNKEAYGS